MVAGGGRGVVAQRCVLGFGGSFFGMSSALSIFYVADRLGFYSFTRCLMLAFASFERGWLLFPFAS